MPFKRMKSLFLLVFLACPAAFALADPLPAPVVPAWEPSFAVADATADAASVPFAMPDAMPASAALASNPPAAEESVPAGTRLRTLLADFAVTLRNVRYRRGGDSPSTGFDCSGFVRYVYQHSLGQELPMNSASQYRIGSTIARDKLETGDLVFFHIRGKSVSHVGIYLGHGRFIHSPSTGRTVSISSLDDAYWARHFAGAKRPKVLS